MDTTTGDDTGTRPGAGAGAAGGAGGGSGDGELFARARAAGVGVGLAYAAQVAVVAELDARDAAVAAGYKSTSRLLEDLWCLDPGAARRLVRHAAVLTERVSLSGEVLPAVLPDTAAGVRAGVIGAQQVEIIDQAMGKVRDIPGLPADDEAAAEALLAESAAVLAPCGLRVIAARLVDTLDPDGAAPPDPDSPVHELLMSRRRRDGAVRLAGLVHGIEGETVFEAVDALATTAGPEDTRSLSQRRAEALIELAAQALSPTGIAARTPCCPDHDPTDRPTHHNPDHHGTAARNSDGTADDHSTADDHGEGDGLGGADREDDDHSDHEPADHGDRNRDGDGDGDGGQTDQPDQPAQPDQRQGGFPEALRGPHAGTNSNAGTGDPITAAGGGPSRPDQCATIPVRGRALLTVTMNLDDLTARVGHGLLDSGLAVTPDTVRRIACDAGIVPILLGSRAEPLDIGRRAYATPDPLRRALHQRDRGCTFPGCTRRPRRCHAHHLQHWLDAGVTALHNLCLLCRYHHYLIHHSGWTIQMINGRPWFTPPDWLDPTRTPRPGGVDTTLAG